MPFRDQYQAQVRLLMRLLPIVAREACFALKGGTAINLFVRIPARCVRTMGESVWLLWADKSR